MRNPKQVDSAPIKSGKSYTDLVSHPGTQFLVPGDGKTEPLTIAPKYRTMSQRKKRNQGRQ